MGMSPSRCVMVMTVIVMAMKAVVVMRVAVPVGLAMCASCRTGAVAMEQPAGRNRQRSSAQVVRRPKFLQCEKKATAWDDPQPQADQDDEDIADDLDNVHRHADRFRGRAENDGGNRNDNDRDDG